MKHTKQNVGMSHRIMAFFLTVCIAASLFLPIVSVQSEGLTSKPILLSGFAELSDEIKVQSVPLGVSPEKLNLPDTLEATGYPVLEDTDPVSPKPEILSIQNVTWESNPIYSDATPGVYTFTAVLPQGYALQEGTVLPKILVTVMAEVLEKPAYENNAELFQTLPEADSITGEKKEAIRTRLAEAMAANYVLTKSDNQVDTFAKLQDAIAAAPKDGTAYVIEVTADFEITTCLRLHATDTDITIRGNVPERKLTRKTNNNYLFSVAGNASLTLENIVIDGNKTVYDTNTLSMIILSGTANLALKEGAVLQNNNAKDQSGAVYIQNSSTFSMSGAQILNNYGRQSGGIVIVEGSDISSINIANSVISGNTTNGSGGGLFRHSRNTNAFALNITGGSQINDNTAAGYGGGIYLGQNATVTMDGGSQMDRNQSGTGYHGGAIYATDNFTLNMSGASQINNNTGPKDGGGIYCTIGASFSIKGGSKINGNEATKGSGGGIYNSGSISKFELESSEICNNKASGHGGGIYAAASGFPLSVTGSSKINGNEATTGNGGGISVISKPFPAGTVVSFEGNSEIVGNTAKYAGAFWLGSDTLVPSYTLNIKDTVKIQDNTASVGSGAIYIHGADITVSTTTPISGNTNTATDKGASALQAVYSTLTLNSGVCVTKNTGGAPVWVTNDSTFTLNSGCVITENTSTYNGGGVYISTGSTIDMQNGSKITNNKANNKGWTRRGGGGIYFSGAGGTIAGEISGNTATDSGGGIYIHGNVKSTQTGGQPKLYIVNGAEIKNNTAGYAGGGLYANGPKTDEDVDPRAIVYVQGGEITGNTANGTDRYFEIDIGGGGIAVARAQAEISGGTITGNTAKVGAGGVQTNRQKISKYTNVGSGKLTISGGTIKDNISGTATDRTAMGIQALLGANLILDNNLANPQSLKVDTSSTLTLSGSSAITTQGNVTIGGNSKLITVDPNGGTVTNMVNFISGNNVVLPPASLLAGEVFGGWYDGTNIYQPGDTVAISKEVTYKAIWKYDVIYKAGTGANSGQADKTAIKYSDINLELFGETYKKTKNVQSGWSISDGGEKAYDLKANYTTNGAITLYPVWSPAGDINVDIGDKDGDPVQGAKVKITQAEQTVPNGTERASDANGKVKFTDLPYGIYNVVVTYDNGKTEIVVTKAIEINGTSLSVSVALPNVRLNTEVVGTVPVAVENLESAITQDEKSEITDSTKPGNTSEIRIVLAAIPEGNKAILAAMDAAAGEDKTLTNYVDVTVTKTLSTIDADGSEILGTSQEIKTTASYQTLSFAILPELAAALANQENATVDNVLVYQRHVDEAGVVTIAPLTKVSAQYGKVAQYDCYYIEKVMGIPYIVVRAKNFSTYAFGLQAKTIDEYIPYIVTFDAVGGSVTPVSAAANIDNTLDALPTPTRSGNYRFDGWYTSADGGTEVTTATVFTSDSTIYAHWTYRGDPDSFYTITPKSGEGGQISPNRPITVKGGNSTGFTMVPDKGYDIRDVKVDGKSVGAVKEYIFTDVRSDHTIEVSFEKATPTPKPQPDKTPDKPLNPDQTPDKPLKPDPTPDNDNPSGKPDVQESHPFILLSALLALMAVILAVLAILKKCTKKRKLLAILGAVAAVLIFLVTTGWSGIAFANLWTLVVALAAILPVLVLIVQRKEDKETGEDDPQ